MSGTSLDGIDLVLVRFDKLPEWQFEILDACTINYTQDVLTQLACATTLTSDELHTLDHQLGKLFGEAILLFLKGRKVDFISSHGHTVFHQPELRKTLQIGNGHEIHAVTGIPVVNNFRSYDVSQGGQGAPLVPVGDYWLFSAYTYCLNLGGIANISYEEEGIRRAYDIVPCNMLLNRLAGGIGMEYDPQGQYARAGTIINSLLYKWDELSYYHQSWPKSLGYEWVSQAYFEDIDSLMYQVEDKLATAVEHMAVQIARACQQSGKILITGGGAFNQYLVERIEAHLPDKVEVEVPHAEIVNFKEALIFAFLGVLRVRNEVNVWASVTGAPADSSSGDMIGF